MALWGIKDNVGSGSTVTLDYDNKVVSGWAGTELVQERLLGRLVLLKLEI